MAAKLTKARQAALLDKLRAGHDLAAACAALTISSASLEASGGALAGQIREACAVGTGRLRARLLEGALSDGNTSVLMRLVEQREQAMPTGQSIYRIERVVVDPGCPACGHRHQHVAGVPDPRPGRQPRPSAPELPADVLPLRPPRPSYMNPSNTQYNPPHDGDRS